MRRLHHIRCAGRRENQEVTPEIQATAEARCRRDHDRREQARALYEWVSARIRYVALYLAAGGVEPHAADSVLVNGYGDCKDHTVLYAAMLRPRASRAGRCCSISTPPTR